MKNDVEFEDPKTLLQDRSLLRTWWELNVDGRRGIKNSRIVCFILASLAIANVTYLYFAPAKILPDQLRLIASDGFRLTTGTMSFLLAGFIFLLSSSNADLLRIMFHQRHKPSKLDYLRYNAFSLLSLFAEFVFAAIVFACLIAFGQKNGMISMALAQLPIALHDVAIKCGFFFVSMLFILIVLRLKSFVSNVYHFAMTGLAFKIDDMDRKERELEAKGDKT